MGNLHDCDPCYDNKNIFSEYFDLLHPFYCGYDLLLVFQTLYDACEGQGSS